jgi:hypothetical protein
VWALTRAGKAYRFTFSRSLAEYLQRWCGPEGLRLERVGFSVGRRLERGEASASGAYAVVSTRRKHEELHVLRVTLSRDVADLVTTDAWREVREFWLSSGGRP